MGDHYDRCERCGRQFRRGVELCECERALREAAAKTKFTPPVENFGNFVQEDNVVIAAFARREDAEFFIRERQAVPAIPPKSKSDEEVEQLRVQLAGVLTAADGATRNPVTRGQWGWSPAYQAVLELRMKYDKLLATSATPPEPDHVVQK